MVRRPMVLTSFLLAAMAMAALSASSGCAPKERNFGSGAGGGGPCKPGDMVACYDGADGTKDVGLCKGGTKTCQADGTFGACEGQVLPATEDCKTPDDEDCNGVSEACPLATLWAGGYGVSGNNNFTSAVAAGDKGGVVIAGSFNGSVNFGNGGMMKSVDVDDAFVARFDPKGGLLWAKQYGGMLDQGARAAAVTPLGAVYVGGSFSNTIDFGGNYNFTSAGSGDVFLAKLGQNGDTLWALAGGDVSDEEITAIAANGAGEVVVAGNFSGKLTLGGSPTLTATPSSGDLFVIKLDASGKAIWAAGTSGMGYGKVYNLATSATGDVLVAAEFDNTLTLGGKIFTSLGGKDCFVARLSGMTGGLMWGRSFGSPVQDRCTGIAVDAQDNVLIAGSFGKTMTLDATTLTAMGAESIFMAKLDPQGNVLSATPYGGGQSGGSAAFLKIDSRGNILLGGYYNGSISFGGDTFMSSGMQLGILDIYVAKLDPTGKHIASRVFGSDLLQAATSLDVDPSDNIFLSGATQGQLDFGTGPVGVADPMVLSPFLVKLSP